MATVGRDIKSVELTEKELWEDGPPHETFEQMRAKCPIHWTESFEMFPEEAGLLVGDHRDDIHAVSRDWQTYSSEEGGVILAAAGFPDRARAGDVHRHGPAQARPPEGPLPGGLHAAADRRPRGAHPPDHGRGARTASRVVSTADLVSDVAQPVVARVIGSFMGDLRGGRRDLGETHELGARRDGPRPQPGRGRGSGREGRSGDLRALPAADRGASRASHRRPHERAGARGSRRQPPRGARDRDGLLPA